MGLETKPSLFMCSVRLYAVSARHTYTHKHTLIHTGLEEHLLECVMFLVAKYSAVSTSTRGFLASSTGKFATPLAQCDHSVQGVVIKWQKRISGKVL
ncbi:hypothetical protein XELAEV_18007887mg [Xenopus laevis]|uniref:Uncharacterized protein n=1 Tax=Xenopus laevis TaxID=8355 RepID=A0A974I5I2_XENLA|nr:hypothetical protein XELAEV_18007887mg [Xenopus laevis]